MYMFKAKQAAQAEFEQALKDTNLTLEQVREYLKQDKRVGGTLHKAPHAAATTGADLVYEVGRALQEEPVRARPDRGQEHRRRGARARDRDGAARSGEAAGRSAKVVKQASIELGEIAKEKGPSSRNRRRDAVREKLATVLPFMQKPEAQPIAAE